MYKIILISFFSLGLFAKRGLLESFSKNQETKICSEEEAACSINENKTLTKILRDDKFVKTLLSKNDIVLFYAYNCPHCKEARKFFASLKNLQIKEFEVKKNKNNLLLFEQTCSCEKIIPSGVPVIFVRGETFIGFNEGIQQQISLLLKNKQKGSIIKDDASLYVPFFGIISLSSISLPSFSIYLGLLDGLNPCAMWVLIFLLGLMLTAKSRKKIIIIGLSFVLASGLVYFAFMATWFNIFSAIGYSSFVTMGLGLIAIVMGLINVKELFFFKKGVSLMIPEKAKPALYKKARKVLSTENTFLAILGTVLLAIFVNFIELACTVGLPAIFTRILSLKNISVSLKYFYMTIYNIAYVVPLAIIVVLFIVTMGRFSFKESHAKILKLISGLLMLALGLGILFFPKFLI